MENNNPTTDKKETKKSVSEILDQLYLSADDLLILMPHLSYSQALKMINEFREKMKAKKMYLPGGKTHLALTNLIRKECGF